MFSVVLLFFPLLPVLITLAIIRYGALKATFLSWMSGNIKNSETASQSEHSESISEAVEAATCSDNEADPLNSCESNPDQEVDPMPLLQCESDVKVESKTLIEEEPYVAVVDNYYLSTTCSNCFVWNIPGEKPRIPLNRCAGCKVLHYCGKKCQKADWKDHKAECKFLRSSAEHSVPGETVRLVCRILTKSKSQPEWKAFNGRTYDSLTDNCEKHRNDDIVMADAKKVFEELEKFMGTEAPDFDTFFPSMSKVLINRFSIAGGSLWNETRGAAIYLGLSVLKHSCRPDAFTVNDGPNLLLRTTKMDCIYSDQITINYVTSGNIFESTEARRSFLQKRYGFDCMCEECMDVELDRKKSSGRPECCLNGWFNLDDLHCAICKKVVPSKLGERAKNANERLTQIMLKVEENAKVSIRECANLIDQCKKVLSNENAFLMKFALNVAQNASNFEISLKYADFCLPQIRKTPFDFYRANFLFFRYLFLEKSHQSFLDEKAALDEALEAAEIVYGPNHEITWDLKTRKAFMTPTNF